MSTVAQRREFTTTTNLVERLAARHEEDRVIHGPTLTFTSQLVSSALDLSLRTIKFCSVVFGVTFRLLVINTSLPVFRDQQTTPLIAIPDGEKF